MNMFTKTVGSENPVSICIHLYPKPDYVRERLGHQVFPYHTFLAVKWLKCMYRVELHFPGDNRVNQVEVARKHLELGQSIGFVYNLRSRLDGWSHSLSLPLEIPQTTLCVPSNGWIGIAMAWILHHSKGRNGNCATTPILSTHVHVYTKQMLIHIHIYTHLYLHYSTFMYAHISDIIVYVEKRRGKESSLASLTCLL